MVNTNKILTVSYGTFSCTLEGFEDSFDTMKAIAEYFRDLAADDRYFGAEPPTPDAEMLARIAEREIARRVEARLENESIVLRADPSSILPVAATAAARPAAQDEDEDEAASEPVLNAPAQEKAPAAAEMPIATLQATLPQQDDDALGEDDWEEDVWAEDATAEAAIGAPADTWSEDDIIEDEETGFEAMQAYAEPAAPATTYDVESVAAKLQRIRAVVSQSEAVEVPEADYSEDEHSDDFLADTHEDIEAALAIDDEAESLRAMQDEDDEEETDALLSEIDAIAGRISEETQDFAEYEAEYDDDATDQETLTEEDSVAEIEAMAEDEGSSIYDDETDEIAELLGRLSIADEADDEDAIEDEAIAQDDTAQDTEFEDEDDAEEALFNESGEEIFDDEDETGEDLAEQDVAIEDDMIAEEEVAAEDHSALRARVIKMKRADFEAAIAAGGLEEEPEARAETAASSLSPEDEADLMRELAAVEAELHADPVAEEEYEDEDTGDMPIDLSAFVTENTAATTVAEAEEDEIETEESLFAEFDEDEDETTYLAGIDFDFDDDEDEDEIEARAADDDEDDDANAAFDVDADSEMNRMFDKAATQMNEEAGKGRRNAIAHLRAAVAAAKAEEGIGGKLKERGPDTEAYRDDLASVVRPRRPEAGRPHTQRPDVHRPAPLKLVAEQRVDIDRSDISKPIRPRRVSMPSSALMDEAIGSDFADYAEDVGAHSLPELLEAAAAYLSFVEGHEQFSRPQLMTQVRQVESDDFSREDGLRSFGQLLREGKIEKLEGGRFKASESISYRPDKRYAGE